MDEKEALPAHPGRILREQFLEPMGLSQYRLAKDINVPIPRINAIVNEKRAVTPDTALRLARYLGTSEGFWLDLQVRYDLEIEKQRLGQSLQDDIPIRVNERLADYAAAGTSPDLDEALYGDAVLRAAVSRLVETLHPERIYLFGSRARDEQESGSDYDLMVILPDDATPEEHHRRQIHDLLWEVGISADVVIWTSSAFDRRARVPASLPGIVMREGRLLYAA